MLFEHPISLIASALGPPPAWMIEAGREKGNPADAIEKVPPDPMRDEMAALQKVRALLNYLPSHNSELAPFQPSSDPVTRAPS